MPRQPRLDAPGLLQHVIARGRRLMTGYVVNFNKRHKRSGHLFQNRYKSIVCEEYSYLLELVRYIHLNPLRAGLVKDLKELDKYPWSGHSVILGRRENPLIPGTHIKESVSAEGRFSFSLSAGKGKKHEKKPDHPACPAVAGRRWIDSVKTKSLAEKTIEDVLLHFGDTINVSRRIYRDFVKKGIDQGRRADLQGGGLVRSAGGDKRGLLGRNKEEREQGDARILGSGDFVGETLQKAEARFEKKYQPRRPIEELVETVAEELGVKPELICSQNKQRQYTEARSLVAFLAVEEIGHSSAEVARSLGITRMGVHKAVTRGSELVRIKPVFEI